MSERVRDDMAPKTDAQRIRDARDRGETGAAAAAKAAAAKAGQSIGIPPQVTRAVATIMGPAAKKVAGVVAVALVAVLLVTTIVVSPGGEDLNAEHSTVDVLRSSNDYMSSQVRRAYQKAAKRYRDDEYGGTPPWGLVAAIGELATENGKVSPYTDDLCDRNPDQTLIRPKAGLSESECEDDASAFPEVLDPIGLLEKQGVGPYLLSKRAARVAQINAQALNAEGSRGEPVTATDYIAFELDRIRRDLIDNHGFAVPTDETTATTLWTEVVRRLPISDPRDATCPTPPAGTVDSTGQAIVILWRCELRRSDGYVTLFDVNLDEDGRYIDEVGGGEAVDLLTAEALTVAWGWSAWGARNSDPILCRPPADNPDTEENEAAGWSEAPPNTPVGVFPLTKPIFEAYKAPGAVDRCDPASNIHAAVNAFLDGEKVEPPQREGAPATIGDRSTDLGEFNPMVGGWWAMPWALGNRDNLTAFLRDGSPELFEPSPECRTAISTWANVVASHGDAFAPMSNRPTSAAGIQAPGGLYVVGDEGASSMGGLDPSVTADSDRTRSTAEGVAVVAGLHLTHDAVLVVDLGTWDSVDPDAFRTQIDSLMAVALDARVLWLTIPEPGYETMNAELVAADARYTNLDVVDATSATTPEQRAAIVDDLVSVGDAPPLAPMAPSAMDPAALEAALDAAGPRPYGPDTACAGAPAGQIEEMIATEAADLASIYALPRASNDEGTADTSTTTSSPAADSTSTTVAAESEGVEHDHGEEQPALPLPTQADHDRARFAANLDGVAAWFNHLADAAPDSITAPATPGVDSMVLRLSSTGRRLEGMPPEPFDQTRESYSKSIVDLAIVFSGLYPDDSRFDPEANPFEGADEQPGLIARFFTPAYGGGFGGGGIYSYSIEGMSRPRGTDYAWGGHQNGKIPTAEMVPIPGVNGPCVEGIAYPSCLHPFAAQSWAEMIAAAAADGVSLGASPGSAYRTYAIQFAINSNGDGIKDGTCCTPAARPGTSNHGWGMAIDINATPSSVAWLRGNARNYGWVEDVTGENWHWAFWAGAKWVQATNGGFGPWPTRDANGNFVGGAGGTISGEVPFSAEFQSAAAASNVPVALLVEQARTESGFADDVIYCRRTSTAGARGISQFMPATAAGMGIDPCDPLQAIPAQARLMRGHFDRYQSWALSLAAYNAGGGNVNKHCGVPPFAETTSYVSKILTAAGMPDDRRRLC